METGWFNKQQRCPGAGSGVPSMNVWDFEEKVPIEKKKQDNEGLKEP